MKVFTCNDFDGFWPIGSAAVVIAEDLPAATKQLAAALEKHGIPQEASFTLVELSTAISCVRILHDGGQGHDADYG